jgi:ubiquitin-conjugating enzyme E2 M
VKSSKNRVDRDYKMLKVWSLKKDEETAKKRKPKTSPAQLRVQKGTYESSLAIAVLDVCADAFLLGLDLTEMELPNTMKTDFPDANDVLNFKLTIDPDEGMCFMKERKEGRSYVFKLTIFSLTHL